MSEQQWWQPLSIPSIAQLMKQCEVCCSSTNELIAVNNIKLQDSVRITPYHICPEWAQKISEALAEWG